MGSSTGCHLDYGDVKRRNLHAHQAETFHTRPRWKRFGLLSSEHAMCRRMSRLVAAVADARLVSIYKLDPFASYVPLPNLQKG